MAISYIKSLGTSQVLKIAEEITLHLQQAGPNKKIMSLRQVMNYKNVLPILIDLLERAKIINDVSRATFIDKDGFLLPEAAITIEYMFYAMVFDKRELIEYAINSNFIKIEQVFGLLLEIKTLDGNFNIINQFSSALEKMKAGKDSAGVKLNADAIYGQSQMFSEWQVRYIEYLCMKLFEETNNKKQKEILENYIRLVTNLTRGFFVDKNDKDVSPERLLSMAFDDASVRHKLATLGDKKKRKGKKEIPCEIIFKKYKSKLKNQMFVFVECRMGEYVGGVEALEKYNHTDDNLYAEALRSLVLNHKLFPLHNSSSMFGLDDILPEIDRKLKTNFAYSKLKNTINGAVIRSSICENLDVKSNQLFDKKQSKKRTKLADKKPKTLTEKIKNWFKNDLKKPYRWSNN